jgi:hypothetical protein
MHIYRGPEDEIPEEDKARLEGFLEGRAESDALRKEEADELRRTRARVTPYDNIISREDAKPLIKEQVAKPKGGQKAGGKKAGSKRGK